MNLRSKRCQIPPLSMFNAGERRILRGMRCGSPAPLLSSSQMAGRRLRLTTELAAVCLLLGYARPRGRNGPIVTRTKQGAPCGLVAWSSSIPGHDKTSWRLHVVFSSIKPVPSFPCCSSVAKPQCPAVRRRLNDDEFPIPGRAMLESFREEVIRKLPLPLPSRAAW